MPFAKRYSDAELRSFRLAIDRRPSIKQLERLHGKEGFLQQAPPRACAIDLDRFTHGSL
jgi:hypothetical protein